MSLQTEMPTNSDNHGFELDYQAGDSWDYNDEFEALEERVEVRDTDANRSNYTPHAGAKYFCTDTDEVYLGDGAAWNYIGEISDPNAFADATHDNAAHTETFAVDGDTQPPQGHGNGAHSSNYAYSSTHSDVDIQIDETNGVIDFVTQ